MRHVTVNGELTIRRRIYWSKASGSVCPADALLGIERANVSVGVRERCCQEALDSSFSNVVRSLRTLGQIRLSEDRVRRIVEGEGKQVQRLRKSHELTAAFTAGDCVDGVMVTGADGVMVPVVPETQKARRRATEAARRKREGRRSTRRPGRPKKGTDGAYKEAKVATFYSQDKKHQHVVTTLGDCDELGRLMRREAAKVDLAGARFSYSVADGAPWIARQYRTQLPMIDEHVLDWYHFKEHVVQTSHAVYGEANTKANQWRDTMLETAWKRGSLAMLGRLGAYERRHTGENRQAFATLRRYIEPRLSLTDYPRFLAQGYDCGSGPTESQCGTTTARVKGPGMRWEPENAQAMLALAALDHSNLWNHYWKQQRDA